MAKKLRFLPILLLLLAVGFAASSSGGKTEAGNIIADGIFLGDEDLSGKTLNEAADAMEAYYEKIAASNLTIKLRKVPSDVLKKLESGQSVDLSKYDVVSTVKVPVSTFGFDYSIEEALRQASTLGQTGKLVGEAPVSWPKFTAWLLGLTAVLSGVFAAIWYFIA